MTGLISHVGVTTTAADIPTLLTKLASRKTSIQTLDHQIFSKGKWKRAKITAYPQVTLNLALDKHPSKVIEVTAVTDTESQSDLWLLDQFLKAGFQMSDLSLVSTSLNAANRLPIRINSAFHATIKGRSHTNELIVCHSLIYVSPEVTTIYLSYDTMVALGIVNHDFLMVG